MIPPASTRTPRWSAAPGSAWETNGVAVNRGTHRWDLERPVRLVAESIVHTGILGSSVAPELKRPAGTAGGGLTIVPQHIGTPDAKLS